jgi:hypothetical protein
MAAGFATLMARQCLRAGGVDGPPPLSASVGERPGSIPVPATPQLELSLVQLLQRADVSDGDHHGAGELLAPDAIKVERRLMVKTPMQLAEEIHVKRKFVLSAMDSVVSCS